MSRPNRSMDWNSLSDVKRLAETKGPGFLVIKFQNRTQYNLCHKDRAAIWSLPTVDVLYEVKRHSQSTGIHEMNVEILHEVGV